MEFLEAYNLIYAWKPLSYLSGSIPNLFAVDHFSKWRMVAFMLLIGHFARKKSQPKTTALERLNLSCHFLKILYRLIIFFSEVVY